MITPSLVEETTVRLLRTAAVQLPDWVLGDLQRALDRETSEESKAQLRIMMQNASLAESVEAPICQDTGIAVFYVRGRNDPALEDAIVEGCRRATREIPLRPNAVTPLGRKNDGSNVGKGVPHVNFLPPVDGIEIGVQLKGAGSENMTALAMLDPVQGAKGVKSFVLDTVAKAGSRPCPPTYVGIGVGGTADHACAMSRSALMRLPHPNPSREEAAIEAELEEMINTLGIGPMGLGGKTTCLRVAMETAHCHTASLPVCVSFQCWAFRTASAHITPEGLVRFKQEGF
jgi:fumarate hydratase subunit alpha